jgi:hypothetical protein
LRLEVLPASGLQELAPRAQVKTQPDGMRKLLPLLKLSRRGRRKMKGKVTCKPILGTMFWNKFSTTL